MSVDKKRIVFYCWTGLGFLGLWLLIDLTNSPDHIFARIINNIWRAVYVTALNFIFFEYALPYILRRPNLALKILSFLFFFWIHCMLMSFGLYVWRFIGINLGIYSSLITFETPKEGVNYGAPVGIFSIFFFGVIKHLYDYQQLKAAAQQLQIEKQEAELNYLKSQTNPHFLFNTLNNIYALAREKSNLAPESILRLSKILRYMLYETTGAYIAIEQEIRIMNDYIELEKLRYDDSLDVNFNHDVENMKQSIPPLLLIPLVENAFKHGVSETRGRPFVDIHLSISERVLSFVVRNSSEVEGETTSVKENIGLSNLRRQLQLLYKEYDLSVRQSQAIFTASLKINLSSHVKDPLHHNRG